MDKDYLVLKRASTSRPSGEWNDDDFDVLADGGARDALRESGPRSWRGSEQARGPTCWPASLVVDGAIAGTLDIPRTWPTHGTTAGLGRRY